MFKRKVPPTFRFSSFLQNQYLSQVLGIIGLSHKSFKASKQLQLVADKRRENKENVILFLRKYQQQQEMTTETNIHT